MVVRLGRAEGTPHQQCEEGAAPPPPPPPRGQVMDEALRQWVGGGGGGGGGWADVVCGGDRTLDVVREASPGQCEGWHPQMSKEGGPLGSVRRGQGSGGRE